jgi:EpsI family protein
MVAVCAILLCQAGVSRVLKIDEHNIGIPGLHDLPMKVSQWNASGEEYMDAGTAAYLRPDEYILRDYTDNHSSNINVFVAYFKSLQNTYGPHSPSICLPGSGWLVSSDKTIEVHVASRVAPVPARLFTMEKSDDHILVLYWYQNDRDVWAEEFHAKLRLLPDLVRYRRSDVSLVRLVTPFGGGAAETQLAKCLQFADQLFPLLSERFASVVTR